MSAVLKRAACLFALVIAGCGHEEDFGPSRTEQRAVGSFDSIEMQGDSLLHVRVGTTTSLELEGLDQLVSETETHIEDGTLIIDNRQKERRWTQRVRPVQVRITMPQLVAMRINGGNHVQLRGFEGGDSRFDIEGAAHVNAVGRLDRLTLNMQGAGHADFEQLVAGQAVVTVEGVGSAYVHATDSLDATMNGIGAILYSGNPREVRTSMQGLGKVGKRDGNERKPPAPDGEAIDPDSLQPEYGRDELEQREPTIQI